MAEGGDVRRDSEPTEDEVKTLTRLAALGTRSRGAREREER